MPLLNSITTPYAEALLQLAESLNEIDEVIEEVKSLMELLQNSSELNNFLASPVVESSTKKEAIDKIFSGKVTDTFLKFMKLLADRQRIAILDSVLARSLELYREQRNIALASVTSAVDLNNEQKDQLLSKIKKIAGTDNLEVDLKVDSSLIGGFTVKVGSKVIDASISGQVRKMALALSKAS